MRMHEQDSWNIWHNKTVMSEKQATVKRLNTHGPMACENNFLPKLSTLFAVVIWTT